MLISVAIGSRANYGSLRSAMKAIRARGAEVRPVAFASALLDRYGNTAERMAKDGFPPDSCLSCHVEGDVTDMARTAGLAAIEWSTELRHTKPDALLVVGDRHEVLGAAMAAAYANVPVVHVMGGEVSGSIDDRVRDAITALATKHCVATERAAQMVMSRRDLFGGELLPSGAKMGRGAFEIHVTGCPRIDMAREAIGAETRRAYLPIIMVSQHPVTTEHAESYEQMRATLAAVEVVATSQGLGVELFWPNSDAGTDGTSRAIREWINGEAGEKLTVRTHRAMPPDDYARMMAACKVLVGNSSSGLREGAWIGTPVVNVGGRQRGREYGANVVNGRHGTVTADEITMRLAVGPSPSSTLYGDGTAGEKVADVILGTRDEERRRLDAGLRARL